MNTRLSHVLIGLFVIALASALVLMGLWLSAGLSSTEWVRYSVYTDSSVGGLRADAPVTFSGVEVGRVQSLELDPSQPGRVHIVLAVRPDAPVRADTRATIGQQGLTGIAFVELQGGSPEQPPRTPPGEPYPVLEARPSQLDRLADSATASLASLQQVLEDVQALLGPGNRQAVTATLAQVESVTRNLDGVTRQLENSLAAVDALVAQGSGAVGDSRRLLRRLERLAGAAGAAVEDLPQVLESAGATLAQVRASADAVTAAARQGAAVGEAGRQGLQRINRSTLPRLEAVLAELGRASRRLDSLLISLTQDPSQLIRGRAPVPPGPGEGTR